MDGHRHVDPVNDASLDREIEAMLVVEPSPEFVARVRSRVAQEPGPGSWRASWMFALAGAVAVVIVAIAVWPSSEPASSITVPVPRRPQVARVEKPSPPEVVPTARRDTTPGIVRAAAAASPATETTGGTSLVPVVAEEDARAFDALLAAIRDPGVMLVFDHETPASALATSAIAITPITIEPLPTTLEGGVE